MGGICAQCGAKVFPKPKICSGCWSTEQSDLALATRGKLYSFSIVHAARKGWPSPYAIAYVDLDDGVRICAPLEADLAHPPPLDITVELIVGTLRAHADGTPVLSHRFKPVQEAR
jgi:uncharacterized OB-fold protein